MIVRKAVFDKIGLLDDGYFMYYEEADFCLRARRAGFNCWYVPASRIVHLVGQASGVTGTNKAEKRRPKYWFDSRKRYFVNNHGRVTAILADVAWAGGSTIHRAARFVRRKERTDPPWLLWDFLRHSFLSRTQRQ
jgi:GT2 family glycosyltransferase